MLIKPTIDELDTKYESRFEISMLAAKRARDIMDNPVSLTETMEQSPLTQAAIEIEKGLIKSRRPAEE